MIVLATYCKDAIYHQMLKLLPCTDMPWGSVNSHYWCLSRNIPEQSLARLQAPKISWILRDTCMFWLQKKTVHSFPISRLSEADVQSRHLDRLLGAQRTLKIGENKKTFCIQSVLHWYKDPILPRHGPLGPVLSIILLGTSLLKGLSYLLCTQQIEMLLEFIVVSTSPSGLIEHSNMW